MFEVGPFSWAPVCPIEFSVLAPLVSLSLLVSLPVGVWCDSGIWSGSAPVELGTDASLTILGTVLGSAGDHGPWARFSLHILTHSRRDLFKVFYSGFGQVGDISGIIFVKEFFKKSN